MDPGSTFLKLYFSRREIRTCCGELTIESAVLRHYLNVFIREHCICWIGVYSQYTCHSDLNNGRIIKRRMAGDAGPIAQYSTI